MAERLRRSLARFTIAPLSLLLSGEGIRTLANIVEFADGKLSKSLVNGRRALPGRLNGPVCFFRNEGLGILESILGQLVQPDTRSLAAAFSLRKRYFARFHGNYCFVLGHFSFTLCVSDAVRSFGC